MTIEEGIIIDGGRGEVSGLQDRLTIALSKALEAMGRGDEVNTFSDSPEATPDSWAWQFSSGKIKLISYCTADECRIIIETLIRRIKSLEAAAKATKGGNQCP